MPSILFALLIGCPGTAGWSDPAPSNDDDSASADDDDATADDDDDATAADDDDTASDTAAYPDEESFFGLAVGNTWEYDEVLSGGPVPVDDVVFVEVVRRMSGPDLDAALPDALTVFEVDVSWLGGRREVHWYGVNGTGAMRWYKSRIHSNPFESEEFEGDAETVLKMAADKTALFGESYDSVWFLPDVSGFDFRGEGATIETFFYGDGREVEGLGNDVYEGDTRVGLEVVKGGWGLLGLDVEVDGENIQWEITRCSICPADSGLN